MRKFSNILDIRNSHTNHILFQLAQIPQSWSPLNFTYIPSNDSRVANANVRDAKRRIRRVLQSAISRIHFAVDIWPSPNKLGVLGLLYSSLIATASWFRIVLLCKRYTASIQARISPIL